MNHSDLSRFDPLHGGCYPGGKAGSGVAQKIINRMPPHHVYIEPFLGGGAVLRYKRPAELNIALDRDPEVIDRWCAAAPQFSQAPADAAELSDSRRRLSRSPAPHRNASSQVTSQNSASVATAAGRSGMRSPAGPAASGSGATRLRGGRSTSSSVAEFGGAGLRWKFLCADAIEFLRNYPWTGRELVYCDPPYLHETRRDLKLYTYEMGTDQHAELLTVLLRIPCPVLLSGYDSGLYRYALRQWHATSYRTMTRRGVAIETLWCNFPPPAELHDYRYLGDDRRERERIKRMQTSWRRRLAALDPLERQALLSVLGGAASTAVDRAGASSFCFEASR